MSRERVGSSVAHYRITAPLGQGGMGEVWRAADPKLGRDVAIKVLPEPIASDPQALQRFESEARAVAALSHPNILAIYDFGKDGDTAYAVTELLEGRTLREQLESGRFLAVEMSTPRFHGDGRADWNFLVTIVYRDWAAIEDHSEAEIAARLFPDRERFEAEEQRRFELLEAHWDVPLEDHPLPQ